MEKEETITEKAKQQELPEQFSDILLVMDKEKKTIQAVKGIGKDGELETVDADEKNQNQFLRLDRHGDMFSNFVTNFFSQAKNPTHLRLFRVPAKIAAKIAAKLRSHLEDPTPEGAKLMDELEIKPVPETQAEEQQQNNSNMETTQQAAQTAQETQTTPETNGYRYKMDDIDWDTMRNLGLGKEKLEKMNLLDPLLKGYKTDRLVPVSLNLGTAITRLDARLSLQRNAEDKVTVAIHGVRQKPNLNYPFFGHEFTKEDKENLLRNGNMGRIVDLYSPRSGESIPSIVSVDRLTNELVALRAEHIKIPDEIKGVKLDEKQKQTLMEGKPLFMKGMISAKGRPFDATLQFNADKRYVEFIFDNSKDISSQLQQREAPRVIRGKELTDKQYEKFKEGAPTYISGFESKEGRKYNGYLTFDPESGKVSFSFNHPDKEQIPKAFRGKKLTDEQFEELKSGKTVHVAGLIDQQGQEYEGYLTYNKETKKTDFTTQVPDELKNRVKPAETNKTQVAVNNQGKTNEATKNINEPLKSGQLRPANTQQQETQQPGKTVQRKKGRSI